MKDNFQQQASREVLVAREFLKAACGQPSSEIDGSRSTLAGRFDFLTKYQAQPPIDPSLSLISKQWVPVGTRPLSNTEASAKTDKFISQNVLMTESAAKDHSAAETGPNGQLQVCPR